jgi:hypothetical protein
MGPEYEIRAQVFAGVALPPEHSSYAIGIRWGTVDNETDTVKANTQRCDWYETLRR